MNDRAISEALGYIFIFGIVMATIAAVYAGGYAGLQDLRDAEQENNAVRAFEVLADNFDDMAARGAPSRATEIKLADSELRFGEVTSINVSVERSSDPLVNDSTGNITVRPIVYDTGTRSDILYVGGAIIRRANGAAMVREPTLHISRNRFVLPVIKTNADDPGQSMTGSTTVLVRASRTSSAVLLTNATGEYDVDVHVHSAQAGVWKQLLESRGMTCGAVADDSVTCELDNVDRVFVTWVKVEVYFEE